MVKKYMDRYEYIFNYEYNKVNAELKFCKILIIVWVVHYIFNIIILSLMINAADKLLLPILIILFLCIVIIKLKRYFLGDIGEVKIVDERKSKKQRFVIIDGLLILYGLFQMCITGWVFLMQSKDFILGLKTGSVKATYVIPACIICAFYILLYIIMFYTDKKVDKQKATLKKYYKDDFEIRIDGKTYKLNPSKVTVQLLSNNGIVLIDNSKDIPIVIDADEVGYIRIEDDLYYLHKSDDGQKKYEYVENYFVTDENDRPTELRVLVNKYISNATQKLE